MKPACVQMITESKRLTSIGLTDCLCSCVCVHGCVCAPVCLQACLHVSGCAWLWLYMSSVYTLCVCVSGCREPVCQWVISETCYTNNPPVIVFSEDGLFDYWNSLGPLITRARHFQANLYLRPRLAFQSGKSFTAPLLDVSDHYEEYILSSLCRVDTGELKFNSRRGGNAIGARQQT